MPSRSLAAPIFTGSAFALKYRAYGVTAFALAALRAKAGRSAGTRTLDPMIKSHLLYQLSYTSMTTDPEPGSENGASEGIRTLDNHLGKVTLYQLSYARVRKRGAIYQFRDLIQLFFIISPKMTFQVWVRYALRSGQLWPV